MPLTRTCFSEGLVLSPSATFFFPTPFLAPLSLSPIVVKPQLVTCKELVNDPRRSGFAYFRNDRRCERVVKGGGEKGVKTRPPCNRPSHHRRPQLRTR